MTVTPPADQTNNESDTVSLAIQASDATDGTLTYSAQGLPPGLAINATTGVITGTIGVGAGGIGQYSVNVMATDGTYSDAESFTWNISSLVSITDPGDQANTVGDAIALPVPASDAAAGTLTYVATGLPAGLSINTSTGVITGSISSSAAAIGTYATTVVASDGTYTATNTDSWTISAAGTVTLGTPSAQTNTEGDTGISVAVSANDTGAGTLEFFAQGLPAGLQVDPATGTITGAIAVGDAAESPYTVIEAATDGTSSASETFLWVVNDPISLTTIPAQTNNESDAVSLSLSLATSPGGSVSYSATGLPTGLQLNPGTGVITGTVAPGSAAGDPVATVTATNGTYTATATIDWTINSLVTMPAVADQTNYEGDSVSLALAPPIASPAAR